MLARYPAAVGTFGLVCLHYLTFWQGPTCAARHTQRKWYVTRASSRDVRSTQRVVRPVRAQRLQLNVIAFRYTVLAIALRDRGLGRPACDTTSSTSTLALSIPPPHPLGPDEF